MTTLEIDIQSDEGEPYMADLRLDGVTLPYIRVQMDVRVQKAAQALIERIKELTKEP